MVMKSFKAGRKSSENGLRGGSWPRGQVSMANQIEMLKNLIATLLKQMEMLAQQKEPEDGRENISLSEELRCFEIELIQHALARAGGKQSRAARLLGVKSTTLNSKIKRYNIRLPYIDDDRSAFASPERSSPKECNLS